MNASRKLRVALFTLIHGDFVEFCFRQELEAQSSYSGVAEWCTNESTWHSWLKKKKILVLFKHTLKTKENSTISVVHMHRSLQDMATSVL